MFLRRNPKGRALERDRWLERERTNRILKRRMRSITERGPAPPGDFYKPQSMNIRNRRAPASPGARLP